VPYTPGLFDAAHLYLQWGGKLPGGDEWSCGLRLANQGSGDPVANAPAMLSAVAGAVQSFHSGTSTFISNYCLLSFVKLNGISTSGTYIEPVTHEAVIGDLAGTGGTSTVHPNQVALAISLTTGVSRGPAHRGRFFMPMPALGTGAFGKISSGIADEIGGSAWSFVQALNGVSPSWKVAVFSRKSGAATHRLVTGVEVGMTLDTQRRRRNKLTETWRHVPA
jgi:hypothetical protein